MNVAWISGWASNASNWQKEIEQLLPNCNNSFLDYSALLPQPDDIFEAPTVRNAEVVIAWSIGSLAMLRNSHRKRTGQRWILVCPIANFCGCGTWNKSAVRATRQSILANTKNALESFAALMGACSERTRNMWLKSALEYTPNELALGLEYLEKNTAQTFPQENISLLFGESDSIITLKQQNLFPQTIPATICAANHWLHNYFPQIKSSF